MSGRTFRGAPLLAALLWGPAVGASEPPCRAEVILEPELAFVEQQVVYRLRILRAEEVTDVRWIDPPSFHSFRAEWLPGRSPDPGIETRGEHRLVFEERRALFPVRPGRLATPRARMACRMGGDDRREVDFQIPSAALEVAPPPEPGRPADWSGLVGRVEVRSTVPTRRVALGDSVALGVSIWGGANVWRAAPPLGDPPGIEGAEVFAERPILTLESGTRLVGRRSFRFDVVPRRAGQLVIPEVRVPYFDPRTGGYAVAIAPPIELSVAVRSDAPAASEAAAPAALPAADRSDGNRGFVAAALLALLAVVAWVVRRRLGRDASSSPAAALLEEAERARARGDRAAETAFLARALRLELGRGAMHDPEARSLLEALDAERFGAVPAEGIDAERLREVLSRRADRAS